MNTAYYMYRDASNRWRWRLMAGGNHLIAISHDGYDSETDCMTAILLVKASSADAVYKPSTLVSPNLVVRPAPLDKAS